VVKGGIALKKNSRLAGSSVEFAMGKGHAPGFAGIEPPDPQRGRFI
jgi:hypothetical protein